MHPLIGRKQTEIHIKNRVESLLKTLKENPRELQDLGEKLKSKIKKEKDCWIWTGAKFKKKYGDYGQIRLGRKPNSRLKRAHIVSYEYFVGKVPKGLELDHLCHNTLCINPKHLEPVTHKENIVRRKDSGLPHCKYGHKYTEETTYTRPDNGRRECKVCRKLRR